MLLLVNVINFILKKLSYKKFIFIAYNINYFKMIFILLTKIIIF